MNFLKAQFMAQVAMMARRTEKNVRNTLLFSSGSVGSNKANQLSLKQTANTIMKVATETRTRMKAFWALRPKYCSTTPAKIMQAPSMCKAGCISSSGQPAACSSET